MNAHLARLRVDSGRCHTIDSMKQLIKQWWNGKAVVIDDGGYVPRVIEQRPWARTFYEKHTEPVRWTAAAIGALVLNDVYNEIKTITAELIK